MVQRELGKLWREAKGPDVPPPDWENAPDDRSNRLSPSYSKVVIEGDRLFVVFNARFAKWVNFGLTSSFAVLMGTLLFKLGEPLFAAFFLILGVATCLLLVWRISSHQRKGDYLVIDRHRRTIELPRQSATYSFDSIDRFQWAHAPGWSSRRNNKPNLNLIVQTNTGTLIRYHILGWPSQRLLEQVVEFSGIPLEDRDKRSIGLFGIITHSLEKDSTDRNTAVDH